MRIGIDAGSTAYSDLLGNFTIANQGVAPVSLSATVGTVGGPGAGFRSITRRAPSWPSPASPPHRVCREPGFQQSAGGVNSQTTGRSSMLHHTTGIHNFYRNRSGTWDLVDVVPAANVNLAQSCNAFWTGHPRTSSCPAWAASTPPTADVVCHEYGHFVVQSLNLGQGGFGEGFADTGAVLSLDSGPILGRDFSGVGSYVRSLLSATDGNIQYPVRALPEPGTARARRSTAAGRSSPASGGGSAAAWARSTAPAGPGQNAAALRGLDAHYSGRNRGVIRQLGEPYDRRRSAYRQR